MNNKIIENVNKRLNELTNEERAQEMLEVQKMLGFGNNIVITPEVQRVRMENIRRFASMNAEELAKKLFNEESVESMVKASRILKAYLKPLSELKFDDGHCVRRRTNIFTQIEAVKSTNYGEFENRIIQIMKYNPDELEEFIKNNR